MPSLEKRVSVLENALQEHLIESGSIKNDIQWIKKSVWIRLTVELTFVSALLVAIVKVVLSR